MQTESIVLLLLMFGGTMFIKCHLFAITDALSGADSDA